MTGSPTLLIDGVDPFAAPGLTAGLSCRLYTTDDCGNRDAVPSRAQLLAVLRDADR